MRLLHQEGDHIFGFCIPTAIFWYKHCFGANAAPFFSTASNFPKFPFSALFEEHETGCICRSVTPSAFIALRRRLHFWVLHTHSYILILTLLWCKCGTILFDSFEVSQISILGTIRGAWIWVYLLGRNAHCVYCTKKAITFLGSAHSQLTFDIKIALVQIRYHCFRLLRIFPNFHSRPYAWCMKPGVFADT